VPPWGRVSETKGQRMTGGSESCASVLNDRARYPRWTEEMVAALPRYRAEGRKWFQMYDKIADERTLRLAWERINARTTGEARLRGAGLDGMNMEAFAVLADSRLPAMAGELKARTWKPTPVKRHWIPKPGSNKKRPLGLPTIADKVVQEAVRGVIEPIWEEQFLDGSHGFRPGRSTDSACRMMEMHLEQGRVWVVDADISGCFDNISHKAIAKLLERRLADGRVVWVIEAMLKAGVMEGWSLNRTSAGTPQGGVISPLLCNIVLHELDTRLEAEGIAWVRYADDFVLLCETREQAERAHDIAAQALAPLGLRLNGEKTRIVHLDEGFDFLGWRYKGRQRWPRDKSVKAFRQKAKLKTLRNRPGSIEAVCAELEPLLRGFFNYFRNGNSARTFSHVTGWLRRRLRGMLRKRQYGKSGISTRMEHFVWPNAYFAAKGLFDLQSHLVVFRMKHFHSPIRG